MSLNKFIQKWSVTMAKAKKAIEHLRKNKEINAELIPAYMSSVDFQEKKTEVQNLIAKMLISSHKRGRPSNKDEEELNHAA